MYGDLFKDAPSYSYIHYIFILMVNWQALITFVTAIAEGDVDEALANYHAFSTDTTA